MKKYLLTVSLLVWGLTWGCASSGLTWKASVDRNSESRFIPIALWSGAEWAGERVIALNAVDSTFGKRDHKEIQGPIQWKHPVTGETLWVYERRNNTTKGLKRQLFTVNPDGTGLAKVFDERPDQPTRYFSTNAVLFPLGSWHKGEKRTFTFEEYVDGKREKRTALVYIRRLSFTYKKVKYAMKYDWICTDAQGKTLFHERYIYGPGQSLMYFNDRLKE
jgi:hypothetical protein